MSDLERSQSLSRRGLLRVAGAAGLAAATAGTLVLATGKAAVAAQSNWRWCTKCQGLWFTANTGFNDFCPSAMDAVHTFNPKYANYRLNTAADRTPGQNGWRWCYHCEGLYFSGNGGGVCPRNPFEHVAHVDSGERARSADYVLETTDTTGAGLGRQSGWRWCEACAGLWFVGNSLPDYCPADRVNGHVFNPSNANYVLRYV